MKYGRPISLEEPPAIDLSNFFQRWKQSKSYAVAYDFFLVLSILSYIPSFFFSKHLFAREMHDSCGTPALAHMMQFQDYVFLLFITAAIALALRIPGPALRLFVNAVGMMIVIISFDVVRWIVY